MVKKSLIPFCLLSFLVSCNYETPTTPSPTDNNNTSGSTASNNNSNTNTTIIVIIPTNPTNPNNPSPNPPTGQNLPLPSYTEGVVRGVAAANPTLLVTSCITSGGNFNFLDLVVDTLRRQDTRFGYVCNQTDCFNISPDRIAYHATTGATTTGVLGIHSVDIIESYCLNPQVGFINEGFHPTLKWSSRGRF